MKLQKLFSPEFNMLHERPATIRLHGKEYPLLGMRFIGTWLARHYQLDHQRVPVGADAIVRAGCGNLFSPAQLLVLGDISADYSPAELKKIRAHLAAYVGPHTFVWFDAALLDDKGASLTLELPDAIDTSFAANITHFVVPHFSAAKHHLVAQILAQNPVMNFDTFLMMLDYINVTSMRHQELVLQHVRDLLETQDSLFEVAKQFFSLQRQPFFVAWNSVESAYPEVFWSVFWSEQLWRAYHVTLLMRQQKLAEAKKIAGRLPFSFMQYQWKNQSIDHLRDCIELLYNFDWRTKCGIESVGLELMFARHFGQR